MKAHIRIPTTQYGYIELEVEPNPEGSGRLFPEVIVELHNEMVKEYADSVNGGDGVTEKEMDMIIQKMISGVSVEGGTELYVRMTPQQQKETQRIKRAMNRLTYNNESNTN